MDLHPEEAVAQLLEQHAQVLSELHGDLQARAAEVDGRVADQGNLRGLTWAGVLLDTVLRTRLRRQTPDSTLTASSGRGISVRMSDSRGTVIPIRSHPLYDGERIEPGPYEPVVGGQFTLDEEFGIDPAVRAQLAQGYRIYILHPRRDLLAGVPPVLAAGIITDDFSILYAAEPLPDPIFEVRGLEPSAPAELSERPKSRRRDDDFSTVLPSDESASSNDSS